jgi:hypothetical protein
VAQNAPVGNFLVGDGTVVGTYVPWDIRQPICGVPICGDGTLCGGWANRFDPEHGTLYLKGAAIQAGWAPDGVTAVVLGRPKLTLQPGAVAVQSATAPLVGRGVLTLKGRPFTLGGFLRLPLAKPRLTLLGRAFEMRLSASLAFGTPKLLLGGGALKRVGRPGLIPTAPETITLTPSTPQAGLLTPSPVESELLVPTSVEVR